MNSIYLVAPFTEDRQTTPHNNLEFIKYYLKDYGYIAEIIDCNHYNNDLKTIVPLFRGDTKPIIGVTAYTRERFYAYDLIKSIKDGIPDSLIIAGGRHFGFLAEETLSALPDVDIVVRGEGEITFKEICDAVKNGSGFSDIKGITYRQGDSVLSNPDRSPEKDIDKFRCFDVKDIKSSEKYSLTTRTKLDQYNRYFTILASRGCPNRCVFCSLSSERVRLRSVDNILQEIEDKIKVTGVRNVSFIDPSLTINKKFIVNLCNKIIENKLNIRWNCYSRVDIKVDVLEVMKAAGLTSVEIGLESASPKVLESIKKNINLDQFERFCKEAYRRKIKTFVFCMISLPDERMEDCDMTRNHVKKMSKNIYSAGIQITRILPDAALYRIAKDRGVLPEDFSWFDPYLYRDKENISRSSFRHIPIYQEHLTQKQIKIKVREFSAEIDKNFFFLHNLKNNIKGSIKIEILKKLTFRKIIKMPVKSLKKMAYAVKNIKKEKYYNV